jgi:hypothetical protein
VYVIISNIYQSEVNSNKKYIGEQYIICINEGINTQQFLVQYKYEQTEVHADHIGKALRAVR